MTDNESISQDPVNKEHSEASCSIGGGACWTSPRMCPGFALMAGWLVAYPFYFFTGSKTTTLIVIAIVGISLMAGLHTRLWRMVKGK